MKIFNYITLCIFSFFLHIEASYWQKNKTPTLEYVKPIKITNPESGLDLIDVIYVINLDSRIDRIERMYQILNFWGLSANRVSACNGKVELSDQIVQRLIGPYDDCMLYRGTYGSYLSAVGCLLSHLSVLKNAYRNGFKIIWVLEDDIEIVKNPKGISSLISKLSSIDPEWDLFYTDPNPHSWTSKYYEALDMPSRLRRPDQPEPLCFKHIRKEAKRKRIDRVYWRTGAYSMVISRRGIKKILDYFSHVFLYDHIDREIHLIPNIRLYSAREDIVTNSLSPEAWKSDIEEKNEEL